MNIRFQNKEAPAENKEVDYFPTTVNSQAAISVHGDEPMQFQEEEYKMLRSARPLKPDDQVSCCGSSRETILVNFQSEALKVYLSPLLNTCREEMMVDSQASTQPADDHFELTPALGPLLEPHNLVALQKLTAYAREKLPSVRSEAEIAAIVRKELLRFNLSISENKAPLQWFLKLKKGYCRHQALFTAYLLVHFIDSYAKENLLTFDDMEAKVYRFRTELQHATDPKVKAGHAMVVYEVGKHLFLLDASRRNSNGDSLVIDLNNLSEDQRRELRKLYSPYDSNLLVENIKTFYGHAPQVRKNKGPGL